MNVHKQVNGIHECYEQVNGVHEQSEWYLWMFMNKVNGIHKW